MAEPRPVADARTLTVRVPISIRQRGGRKLVIAPDGVDVTATSITRHVDNAMVKAIARAFRWNRMLESGEYATVQDLADAEKINPSYVARILRLTLLAPEIVDAILDGRQLPELQMETLLKPFPVEWEWQRERYSTFKPTADTRLPLSNEALPNSKVAD